MLYNPDQVISRLNVKLRTPTPPGSSSSAWSPKTPHTIKQLARQASSIKKLTERRSESPINKALKQLIKGSEQTMHEVILLKKEVHDLQAENGKQKKQRARPNRRIPIDQGLSTQEAQESINRLNQADEAANSGVQESREITLQRAARAPPRCTNCGTVGHSRNRCPNHVNI